MSNRLLSTLFGTLMGFCIPLFLWVLFAEHLTLFILVPIIPIIGIVIGFIFGIFRRIPPLKIWVSLLIFTIFVGATYGYAEIRGKLLRSRRENIALDIVKKYPNIRIIETKYSDGNGMEIPPNVTVEIESDSPFEEMAKYYDNELNKNGWSQKYSDLSSKLAWRKRSNEAFLSNRNRQSPTVKFRIDYWGYWMTHFAQI